MLSVAKRKQIDAEFGRRLRVLRERAGLSQEALGELVGMKGTAVARLERAEREPTWGAIKRFADALKAELNEFREAAGEPPESPAEPIPPSVQPRAAGKRK